MQAKILIKQMEGNSVISRRWQTAEVEVTGTKREGRSGKATLSDGQTIPVSQLFGRTQQPWVSLCENGEFYA